MTRACSLVLDAFSDSAKPVERALDVNGMTGLGAIEFESVGLLI